MTLALASHDEFTILYIVIIFHRTSLHTLFYIITLDDETMC